MANKLSSKPENNSRDVLRKLLAYCRQNDWAGYDPYDALNSSLFDTFPLLDSRIPRLVMTQALKRSPVNLRNLLAIPKTQNPKALALFLMSFVRMSSEVLPDREDLIKEMIGMIAGKRSAGFSSSCWGYSFPWQTRKNVVPAGTPNLVCTTFVANALLDAYDQLGESLCLSMAASAAEYILNELYWKDGNSIHSFSYPLPSLRVQVHNANFLAAALLCRVSKLTGERKFIGPAFDVARCSIAKQKPDGSWDYGEAPSQRWIDNFHTGFNLGALQAIGRYAQTTEFDNAVRRGFEFYRTHFFREDSAPKYFHNRTYPIDIHCVAQSILTLLTFKDVDSGNLPLAHSVLQWAVTHMWDDRGFFYYRVLKSHINRISYMRWSQAWMLLAMAMLQEASSSEGAEELDARLARVAQ